MVLLYLIGCIITYGVSFGYFQKNFPSIASEDYYKDMAFSIIMGLFSVYSLIGFFLFFFIAEGLDTSKLGFKLL